MTPIGFFCSSVITSVTFVSTNTVTFVPVLINTSASSKGTFSIFDSQARDYMLMIPNTDSIDTTTETRTFVFKT